MELSLRPETPADEAAISTLLRAAFADHPHGGNNLEYRLVETLRAAGALSTALLAWRDGELLGCVFASPSSVGGTAGWHCLAPLAVLPAWQGQGVGRALLTAALSSLKASGARGVVLVGEPGYYAPNGLRRIAGVSAAGIPDEYVLALPWLDQPQGEIAFHPAFAVLGE